jgi:copper(I)-binding protein
MKRLILSLLLIAGACSSDTAPLAVSDTVIRKPLPGMHMSAGYFTLTNNTAESIVITHVTSPQFGAVEMHETIIEDGVARMVALGDLMLAPESTIQFQPGGKHLMLMRPAEDLADVTLEFHSGDDMVLSITVAITD